MSNFIVFSLPVLIPLIVFIYMIRNGFKSKFLIVATIIGLLICVVRILQGQLLSSALIDSIMTFLIWYILLDLIYRIAFKVRSPRKESKTQEKNYKKAFICCLVLAVLFAGTTVYYAYVNSSLYTANIQEEITKAEVVIAKYNKIATHYGYTDHDDFSQSMGEKYDIDMDSLSLQEQVEAYAQKSLKLRSYDNCFGTIDPYNEKVINSLGDYMDYVYATALDKRVGTNKKSISIEDIISGKAKITDLDD